MTRRKLDVMQENFQLRKDQRYLQATLELRTQERDAARAALELADNLLTELLANKRRQHDDAMFERREVTQNMLAGHVELVKSIQASIRTTSIDAILARAKETGNVG